MSTFVFSRNAEKINNLVISKAYKRCSYFNSCYAENDCIQHHRNQVQIPATFLEDVIKS